jgi:GAF domain-containing protein
MCRRVPPKGDSRLLSALETWIRILGAQKGNIQLYDRIQGALSIKAQVGFGREFLSQFRLVRPGPESVCGQALDRREMVVSEDVFRDDRFPDLRGIFRHERLTAVFSIPMIARGGAVQGVFSAHFTWPHSPEPSDVRLMEHYVSGLANTLERERGFAAL